MIENTFHFLSTVECNKTYVSLSLFVSLSLYGFVNLLLKQINNPSGVCGQLQFVVCLRLFKLEIHRVFIQGNPNKVLV